MIPLDQASPVVGMAGIGRRVNRRSPSIGRITRSPRESSQRKGTLALGRPCSTTLRNLHMPFVMRQMTRDRGLIVCRISSSLAYRQVTAVFAPRR